MKDSDIEWIGKIPKQWETSKIGELYNLKNIKVSDKDYPPLSVTKKGILPQLETAAKSDAHDDRKLVNKGDFVINSRSDRRGSCGISSLDGSVSLINIVLSPKRILDSEYYNWLFHTDLFADEFYRWGHGIVDDLWTTNWQNMKNINIPIPPLDEQKYIAKFLNKKCGFIDSIIYNENKTLKKLTSYKQSLIVETVTNGLNNTVEMAESNIEWIGKIPEHWEIKKGKIILTQLKRRVSIDDEVITCFRDGEVTLRSKRRETGFTMSDKEIGYQGIEKDDLVVHGMDGFAGAIGISDSRGKGSPTLIVLDSNQNKKYLMYYLRSLSYNNIFVALSTGIRVRSCDLSWNKLSNLLYLIPPLNEQTEIASYLDKKCDLIDSLIIDKEKIIGKLEEYKKSLIFEYVTGKKEVPTDV